MTDLVNLTINGIPVSVPKGTLLVEAARAIDLEIPVFCYHPKLKPVGACRMCLVEIEKMPRLQTACTTPVAEGMVVHTNTPKVIEAQNAVIELILANHPLDCPICDKGGECPLQDNAFKYGRGESRYTEEKRHLDKAFPLSDRILLDRERCIMCLRCVRFQQEIPGDEALCIIDRGGYSEIGTLPGETFDSPFSGNTIELCPVGALTSRQYRFKARPWDLKRTPSVCAGCAVGCNIELHSRDGRILRMWARDHRQVNDGWLCDYGRFDSLPAAMEKRPRVPLVRAGGALRPASWEEALGAAARLLKGGSAGLVASPALTNEAIWAFADALRGALPGAAAGFFPTAAAPWPLRGRIADLPRCKSVLLVGLDPWVDLPVLALWIRKAVVAGGRLVVIGAENGLFRDTTHWLRVEPGQEIATARELLTALQGGEVPAEVAAAARALSGTPVALLAGPAVAADEAGRAVLEALAAQLAAGEATTLLMAGSPALSANGRGVLELAPDLASLAPWAAEHPLARAAAGELQTLLLVGHERWPSLGGVSKILATYGPFEDDGAVEVVLPLAHPYEQAGSLTNLEGRVQRLEQGGLPPQEARADWLTLVGLVVAVGGKAPADLRGLRAALGAAHPAYASALRGDLPLDGRRLAAEEASVA